MKTPPDDDVSLAYDDWAENYDQDANATRDLDAFALRSLPFAVAGLDVLELGCGTGKNTAWLAERARSVVAYDFSEGMLAKARSRISAEHVRFEQRDIRAPMPWPTSSFDLVTVDLVLEHVAALGPVFAEAARVLRRGGRLHVCELHPFRQYQGKQARFSRPASGDLVLVQAYRHDISDYLTAALLSELVLESARELKGPSDLPDAPPRIVSLAWRRGD